MSIRVVAVALAAASLWLAAPVEGQSTNSSTAPAW